MQQVGQNQFWKRLAKEFASTGRRTNDLKRHAVQTCASPLNLWCCGLDGIMTERLYRAPEVHLAFALPSRCKAVMVGKGDYLVGVQQATSGRVVCFHKSHISS
jgi:hypothetical protein